jgi:hypothetical protein
VIFCKLVAILGDSGHFGVELGHFCDFWWLESGFGVLTFFWIPADLFPG